MTTDRQAAPDPDGKGARKDVISRTRVAQLEQRYRRVSWLFLVALGITVAIPPITLLMLQDSRLDAAEDACKRDDRQARVFRDLVSDGPDRTRAKVAAGFPMSGERYTKGPRAGEYIIGPDCRTIARDRTGVLFDVWPL